MNLETYLDSFRVADTVRRFARDRGDRPALNDAVTARTWAELDATTNRVAQALIADGVRPGDRVAVLDRNSAEIVELLLGAAKAGAVLVPLNWRLTPAETLAIVADAHARMVVVHQEFANHVESLANGPWAPRVLVIGDGGTRHGADYERWWGRQPDTDPDLPGTGEDPVLLMYTSGTTGVPKGVVGTNRNVAATTMCGTRWGLDADSVILTAMPMFHIGGLSSVLVALGAGVQSVIARHVVARELLDTMEQERITATFLVPTVIAMLLEEPGIEHRDFSTMRSMIYGASPITPALLRRALHTFRCPLFQVYGLTETHGAICQLEPDDHDPDGPREHLLRSAGRPYPWVELRTVEPLTGEPTAPGEPGEIHVRGPNVTHGYHDRPDETAIAIDEDGWFHTGDVGSLDREGFLTISDRLKDMIITGAENVYPTEVEAVLAEHPDVASVAVIGTPDPRWGETVRAVVVPWGPDHCDAAALITYVRERLAAYKCPKRIDFVDVLPLGPTGKVLKRELRAAIVSDDASARVDRSPTSGRLHA